MSHLLCNWILLISFGSCLWSDNICFPLGCLRFLGDGYRGVSVVTCIRWRRLTDAEVCLAAGQSISQRFVCIMAPLARCLVALFSVGICHCYSQAASWCNATSHEIMLCGVGERGQKPNVLKRIWLQLWKKNNNWEKAFMWVELVTLSRTLEEVDKRSPREHWGEYVLSTWEM